MKLSVATLIGFVLAAPAFGSTVTVTFDGGDYRTWVDSNDTAALIESQGFLYETSLYYSELDDITLHDDVGITFTGIALASGGTFTPKKIDALVTNNIYQSGSRPKPSGDDGDDDFYEWVVEGLAPGPIITFYGFGGIYGDAVLTLHPEDILGDVLFGPEFEGISGLYAWISYPEQVIDPETGDTIKIEFVDSADDGWSPGQVWCDDYCGALNLDNLVVELPVAAPLPASGLLLGGAALLLAGVRRARRG